MINSFLQTLVNSQTPPVNPSSTVGDVYWALPYTVKTYTGAAALAEQRLFDPQATVLTRLLCAIQYLWIVQNSVLYAQILEDDPRITYNTQQLIGQFENASGFDRQRPSQMLQALTQMQPPQFLTGELLEVYRSALSPVDKLAAVICHFGRR